MISISKLLCDATAPGDNLRYGKQDQADGTQVTSTEPRPIVVWNCTRKCNLHCVHCYSSAGDKDPAEVLNTEQAKSFIRDLADFGVPVILFSGGEPLLREDIFELANFAREQGIRTVLSTNGTLISKEVAKKIRNVGFAEVGISLDGIGTNNDKFRGKSGAYEKALRGIRNCVMLGLRVSLRLTITRFNHKELPAILDLVEREGIDRLHGAKCRHCGLIQYPPQRVCTRCHTKDSWEQVALSGQKGKVFTLRNLDRLIDCTKLKDYRTK